MLNYRSYLTIKIPIAITDFKHILSGAVCLLWATVEACQYNMAHSIKVDPLRM